MSMMDQHVESLDEILQGVEDGKNPEEIEKQVEEAEQILQEMKIELHSVTNKQKKDDYIIKMQSYQRIIAKHKKDPINNINLIHEWYTRTIISHTKESRIIRGIKEGSCSINRD